MKKVVLHVVGARPNFIKASPLIKQMENNEFQNILVHTGQHFDYNMSQQFFNELEIPKPDYNLGINRGSHTEQTAKIMIAFEKVLKNINPDLVVVYGDVNSCLAAALVAKKTHLKVAHIEAGLRSFDRSMPEEINRIITDSISDLHFVTCKDALVNLENEGVNMDNCYFVGNTMIDSLVEFNEKFDTSSVLKKFNLTKKGYALITLHRPSNVDDKNELLKLMDALVEISELIKCIFVIHPRTKSNLCRFGLYEKYDKLDSLRIIEPLGYIDFLSLQKNSKLVITDSGGVQEETTFFKIPCLTVRENTERPITIKNGTNTLVGSNYEDIYQYVRKINYSVNPDIELWDGKSSERIVDIIDALEKIN